MASVSLARFKNGSTARWPSRSLTNFQLPGIFPSVCLNEGRTIAQLSHTNIITIHDIGIANGLHYISMEYIEGGNI